MTVFSTGWFNDFMQLINNIWYRVYSGLLRHLQSKLSVSRTAWKPGIQTNCIQENKDTWHGFQTTCQDCQDYQDYLDTWYSFELPVSRFLDTWYSFQTSCIQDYLDTWYSFQTTCIQDYLDTWYSFRTTCIQDYLDTWYSFQTTCIQDYLDTWYSFRITCI